MRIRWRIRCGSDGDMFDMIRASHLTKLNICWSRPMHNLILTYQLSMRSVTSHHLTGQHTIIQVTSRSGNCQKGTDHDYGFAGVKTRGVRICPHLIGLATCWSWPKKIYQIPLRLILSELTMYSARLVYWTTFPVDHTASDDKLGWTPNYNTSPVSLAKHVKVKLNSTLVSFTL